MVYYCSVITIILFYYSLDRLGKNRQSTACRRCRCLCLELHRLVFFFATWYHTNLWKMHQCHCHSLRNVPITQNPAHAPHQASLRSCLSCPAWQIRGHGHSGSVKELKPMDPLAPTLSSFPPNPHGCIQPCLNSSFLGYWTPSVRRPALCVNKEALSEPRIWVIVTTTSDFHQLPEQCPGGLGTLTANLTGLPITPLQWSNESEGQSYWELL